MKEYDNYTQMVALLRTQYDPFGGWMIKSIFATYAPPFFSRKILEWVRQDLVFNLPGFHDSHGDVRDVVFFATQKAISFANHGMSCNVMECHGMSWNVMGLFGADTC